MKRTEADGKTFGSAVYIAVTGKRAMQLTTKIKNTAGIGEPEIPAGTCGNVIDVIIEDGKARFLLDFPQYDFYEWYDADEIEDKF